MKKENMNARSGLKLNALNKGHNTFEKKGIVVSCGLIFIYYLFDAQYHFA